MIHYPCDVSVHGLSFETTGLEWIFCGVFAFIRAFIHYQRFAYYIPLQWFYSEIIVYTKNFVLSYSRDIVFTLFYEISIGLNIQCLIPDFMWPFLWRV